jgi:hypothetical protein
LILRKLSCETGHMYIEYTLSDQVLVLLSWLWIFFYLDRHKRMLTLAPSSVTERRTVKETESVLKCAESVLSLSAYLGTLLSL